MNKISPFYGAPLQAFGYWQRMQRDGACQYSISLPAFSAQNNKGNYQVGRFFRPLKAFFFLFLLLMLASCSNEPKLPEPPISFPFLAWKAGEKLDFQFRIKEKYLYEFSIDIYYKEQAKDDYEDMERVRKLVGTYGRDSTGKIKNPGISIPLKLKVIREDNDEAKTIINETIFELEKYAQGGNSFSKMITEAVLEPGNYRCQVESLSDIPEFAGREMKFFLARNHAK